jgi:uncharacterized protein
MTGDHDIGEWQARFESFFAARPDADDGSHDVAHFRRVWRTASVIADAIAAPADRLVLLAAAYFHDLVAVEKNHPDRAQASRLAAAEACTLLDGMGFPSDRLAAVRHAIEAHSFSANIAPETDEARIVQDADRMEALGAIGLARTFYVAGRLGGRLFDPDDPLAERRAPDDKRFALDHFETKLLRLPDMMQTAPGRAMAQARAEVLRQFVRDLLDEIGAREAAAAATQAAPIE